MELKDLNDQVLEEASRWFIECRAGELDPGNRREFVRWLKRSPEHVRVYLEIAETYSGVPDVKTLPESSLAALIDRTRARVATERNVLPLGQPEADKRSPGVSLLPSRAPRARLIALAATLVLGVAAVLLAWRVASREVYVTDIGEQRSVTLEDGSRVELNAGSKIRVRFSASQRGIDLLRGEALFQAAKDERRPFIVNSGAARVRAIGTRFDVNRRASRTIVSVVDGRVALSGQVAAGESVAGSTRADRSVTIPVVEAPIILAAGEQAVITPKQAYKAEHANIAAATAWTHGEVEFDQTPLAEVADEFNRHSRRRLVIDGSDLAAVRISCVYSLDDAESLIRFLQSQSDLSLTRVGSEIHVTRKK